MFTSVGKEGRVYRNEKGKVRRGGKRDEEKIATKCNKIGLAGMPLRVSAPCHTFYG